MAAVMEKYEYTDSATNTSTANWLQDLLKDWANWYVGQLESAYSDSTTLWRAQFAKNDGGFASTIPKGVEPPPGLRKLCHVMNNLLTDNEMGQDVNVVRHYYCGGEAKTMAALDLKRRKMFEMKGRGESAIRARMKA